MTGLILVGLALATGACASLAPGGEEEPPQLGSRQVVVALRLVAPTLRAEQTRRLARYHDIQPVGAFPLASIGAHCVVYEVPPGRSIDAVLAALVDDPEVVLAERNQRFEMRGDAHSDPYAEFQHGATRIGADAVHAWSTGRGVRVGVVDTGVDGQHPDLRGAVLRWRNFVRGGEASFGADPHGTAVAGVIAARANDGIGIYGIAPDAELVVAKACWHPDPGGEHAICSSWTIARAIDYALGSEVHVLNLSLGGPPDRLIERLLLTARGAGVAVVAAVGGRDPVDPGFPASLESVIAVAESESGRGGLAKMLAAPGREILTTLPGGGHGFRSGSSLATAYAAGALALLLQQAPDRAPADVAELLWSTARRAAGDGAGRPPTIDVCAALRALTQGSACAEPTAPS